MQRLFTLLTVLLCTTLSAFAQGDSPYARFGYEGKVLRTPQERQQRMMLVVPNPDTTATVAKVGLDPAKKRYYLFDKQNQVLASDTLAATTVSRFLSVDPLAPKYPWYTPYQFAGNTPIWATDIDGLEPYYGGQAYSGYDLADVNRDGKVSGSERKGNNQALALYGVAALDAFVFKGWLTSTYLAYTLGDAIDNGEKSLNARKAGNSQAAGEYSNQSKEAYTQFAIGVGMIGATRLVGAVANRTMLRTINSNSIAAIEAHLGNPKFAAGAIENSVMIKRLKSIATGEITATEIDINFHAHETREIQLMGKGMSYEAAHESVLKEQGMYHRGYDEKLYTKDALDAAEAAERAAYNKK